jgi:hypothetical protein
MFGKDEKHDHEFKSEEAATAPKVFKTGERVDDEGAFACINCGTNPPPMVNLLKDQMIPVCGTCGPESRWSKI